jgi:glutamyl-tRNA reductase
VTQRSHVDSGPSVEAGLGFAAADGIATAPVAAASGGGAANRPVWQRLFVVGMSHRTAPLDVRELLARPDDEVRKQLQQAAALAGGEALLLSTCNRVELYAALPDNMASPGGDLRAQLQPFEDVLLSGTPSARSYLYHHVGEAALRHLFRVASSLDSLVVGEPQILGQVKAAYRLAQAEGTLAGGREGPLSALLPRAFSVAKRVRSETPIGRAAASVASVGVELATQVFGELRGHPVLLIGAGKMAELCARHLREAGADTLLIANRTRRRAEELAARLGGSAHDLTELETLLARAAVVVCSAGAAQPLVTSEQVQRVMRARRGRWLLFIDIAVPRDVDAAVGTLDNVYLYDIDALSDVAAGNRAERERAAQQAEAIIEGEILRTRERQATADVTPVIKALRKKAEGIAQSELARVLPRLSGLSERDRALVSGLADAVVNKLLHEPLTALKRSAAAAAAAQRGEARSADRPEDRASASRGPDLLAAVQALWSLAPQDDPGEAAPDEAPQNPALPDPSRQKSNA